MKAICVDGTEVECGSFKAVKAGVVLTADKKRKEVIGFVPTTNLSYILPDDVAAERTATAAAGDSEEGRPTDETNTVAEGEQAGDVDDATEGVAESAVDVEAAATGTVSGVGPEADAAEATEAERGEATGLEGSESAVDDEKDAVAGLVSGAPESTTVDPDEDLSRLAGLGDTYAERFRAAGIETVSDLRQRSVDEIADVARVPRGRAERWLRLVTARDDGTGADSEDPEPPVEETAPDADASDTEPSESS